MGAAYSEVRLEPSVIRAKLILLLLPVLEVGLAAVSDLLTVPELHELTSAAFLALPRPSALFAF
jgi:hypothetical protein